MTSASLSPAVTRSLQVLNHTIADSRHLAESRRHPMYERVVKEMTPLKPKRRVSIHGSDQTVTVVGFSNNGHGKSFLCAAWDKGNPVPLPPARLKKPELWEEWTGESLS